MAGFPFDKEKEEDEGLDDSAVDGALDEFAEDGAEDESAGLELEIEIGAGPADLESGAQDLVDSWQPTTPEGEQYKQDLEELLGQFGPMEGGEEEGISPEGFGFDIARMGKEAAKRAME